MPEATLRAFADHGDVQHPLSVAGAPNATLRRAREAGIDLDAVTSELEREGVDSFCDSYRELLDCIEAKLRSTQAEPARVSRSWCADAHSVGSDAGPEGPDGSPPWTTPKASRGCWDPQR